MGLFDNPLGFIFGDDGDQGTIDRRVNREPEGQRWWERWEQTFGQGGPMDPMNVYPRAITALESLMRQYFPGWGNMNYGLQTPVAPAPGGRLGNRVNPNGRPTLNMPGILDLEQDATGSWGAGNNPMGNSNTAWRGKLNKMPANQTGGSPMIGFNAGAGDVENLMYRIKKPGEPGYDPSRDLAEGTPQGATLPLKFNPDDLMPISGQGGPQNMSYRIKKPGEPGYDPVRDGVHEGFSTSPVGNGYAMNQIPSGGMGTTPGLLEPVTLSIDGKRFPIVTRYDKTRNDLAMQYVAALTGMMDPWFQGGMELERGRYGQPYQTQGSDGLLGGALNSFAGGFGKSLGNGAGNWAGGKLFG